MEFSRQEYWTGLPFPSPEDLPNLGTELWSPALQADYLPSEPKEKPPHPPPDPATPLRMAIIKSVQTLNAGEGVEKGEPSYTVGGNLYRAVAF